MKKNKGKEPKFSPGIAAMKLAFEKMYKPESFKDKYTFKFTPYSATTRRIPKGCKKTINSIATDMKIGVGIADDIYISVHGGNHEVSITKEKGSVLLETLYDIRARERKKMQAIVMHTTTCKDVNYKMRVICEPTYDFIQLKISDAAFSETGFIAELEFPFNKLPEFIEILENIECFLRPQKARNRK
jgi:hypothetical protein